MVLEDAPFYEIEICPGAPDKALQGEQFDTLACAREAVLEAGFALVDSKILDPEGFNVVGYIVPAGL